jgi:putative addiction module killer protein
METQEWEIREYLRLDGRCPFRKWLRSLKDVNARARIRVRINRIRLGNFGDCKSVGNGVSEFRINYGPGYRVYFGRVGEKLVLLLCGGTKKNQEKDIKLAKEYWYDYKKRKKE